MPERSSLHHLEMEAILRGPRSTGLLVMSPSAVETNRHLKAADIFFSLVYPGFLVCCSLCEIKNNLTKKSGQVSPFMYGTVPFTVRRIIEHGRWEGRRYQDPEEEHTAYN